MYYIYKLISDKTNQIYIGSTKANLNKRFYQHKKSFELNKPITSRKLFELGGNIEIIELMKVNTKHKQLAEFCESVYIKIYKDICINKNIPGRTQKEYYKDNKEKLKIKRKQYYNENLQLLSIKSKQYYKDNIEEITKKKSLKNTCECGGQYRTDNYSHHLKTIKHNKYIESLE